MAETRFTLFAVPEKPRVPEDADARRAAVDTGHSVLVEAPAGAGKTNLLMQRFLALLAEVEEPEQILAITFTRAATAEMRGRILGALAAAEAQPTPQAGEGEEMPLARRALRHAQEREWRLLEQPHRLDIETIDSLCLRLAHGQPLLARLGGRLSPAEDADALYAMAARRTTALLGRDDGSETERALQALLLRRDNSLPELERMLARMLARRTEWLGRLPLRAGTEAEWDEARVELEQPFAREHARVAKRLCELMETMPALAQELLELVRGAAENLAEEPADFAVHRLPCLKAVPGASPEHVPCWRAISFFLLTSEDTWRKSWNVHQGFAPPGETTLHDEKQRRTALKQRMKDLCGNLQTHASGDELHQALCQLRTLPPLHYSDVQWATLRAVFEILRRAVAELRVVFAEANQVDFPELAHAAEAVLRDETSLRGLLESERKRHLLIDEFQDTSRTQFDLLAGLLSEWSEGDGRTAFVVGDPLQSIYGFRQAEVALFHETREHGLPCGDERRHACHPLRLTHNFRSHRALVEELNGRFHAVFAENTSDRFTPSTAWPQPESEQSFMLHPFYADADSGETTSLARLEEARQIARLLADELPRIHSAERAAQSTGHGEYRVAVLVRTRTHLAAILPALREAGVPFRAVELEPLADQPEVHDLLMLLRALLHAGDRVAWLSVLRAPWCGLSIADLHMLAGDDDPALLKRPLTELIEQRAPLLSPEGRQRLTRTWDVLRGAQRTRYSEGNSLSLAAWVERTWTALGGPACVASTARENAEMFLQLLDTLAPSGVEVLRGDFAARLARLCAAPDARVSEHFGVQVMTMHKAKGLGFEVVLLPALERITQADTTELATMLLRAHPEDPLRSELLLAPVDDRDDAERDPLLDWVRAQRRTLDAEERKRLFYVACTRARTRLHLFATLCAKNGKLAKPQKGSLLEAAWPALGEELEARWEARRSGKGLAMAAVADAAPMLPKPDAETPARHHTLERLPVDWQPSAWAGDIADRRAAPSAPSSFTRPAHGSPAARVRGTALHGLMEKMAALFAAEGSAAEPLRWSAALNRAAVRALREAGFPAASVSETATQLTRVAIAAAQDPIGRWLLAPHPGALAESAWQSVDASGALRTLRVDRSFRGGDVPHSPGDGCQWIVDYKTGRPPDGTDVETWLDQQKEAWHEQLAAYGAALSSTQDLPLRYGLYFPELLRLIHWRAEQ